MLKTIDPDDSYIVREMFACGHGHALSPRYTHYEAGEACPWGHSSPGPTDNESYHLYHRLLAVPVVLMSGENLWDELCKAENAWVHFPLAPAGLTEGTHIGDQLKTHETVIV